MSVVNSFFRLMPKALNQSFTVYYIIYRSSCSQMFSKIGCLKNFIFIEYILHIFHIPYIYYIYINFANLFLSFTTTHKYPCFPYSFEGWVRCFLAILKKRKIYFSIGSRTIAPEENCPQP